MKSQIPVAGVGGRGCGVSAKFKGQNKKLKSL